MSTLSLSRSVLALILTTLVTLSGWHCRSTNDINDSKDRNDTGRVAIYLERGVCFGRCPVYNLTVYGSGRAVYAGEQNVKFRGTFEKKFDPDLLNEIFELASELGYFEMEHEYRNPHLSDFPTIRSSIDEGSRSNHVLRYTDDPPANLIKLEDNIDSLFGPDDSWNQTSDPDDDLN